MDYFNVILYKGMKKKMQNSIHHYTASRKKNKKKKGELKDRMET
jgi:hypothetical protein